MKSRTVTADKPLKTIVHNTTGDDVENRNKKPKKKTADSVLRSRNDDVTRTKLSLHAVKRKSEQLTNHSAEQDEVSGCPLPKKPSPEHIVSIHFLLSRPAALRSVLDTVG